MGTVFDMINWPKLKGLLPAIVQDVDTSEVLAVTQTSQSGLIDLIDALKVSRGNDDSRNCQYPMVQELFIDCDVDCLLVKARATDLQRAEARNFYMPLEKEVPDNLFTRSKLVLAVTQDVEKRNVLMAAFMNEESMKLTFSTNLVHYFSRSRQKLWKKGEESGHIQHLVAGRYDLKAHALVFDIRQEGPACHDGYRSCFYRRVNEDGTLGIDGQLVLGNRVMGMRVGRIIGNLDLTDDHAL